MFDLNVQTSGMYFVHFEPVLMGFFFLKYLDFYLN